MSSRTQFGNTLFLSGVEPGSTAKNLNRLHFEKNAPSPAEYDEAWLQRLIMRHPSLLQLGHIEPAFNSVVPICIELSTNSEFWITSSLRRPLTSHWLSASSGATRRRARGNCPNHLIRERNLRVDLREATGRDQAYKISQRPLA